MSVPAEPTQPASLKRRLASAAYETLPVLAIVLAVGLLFLACAHLFGHSGTRLPRAGRAALFLCWYGALAAYFMWCWRHGQTLPMRAWRLRVTGCNGQPATRPALALRYVISSVSWGLFAGGLFWLREHPTSVTAWLALIPLTASYVWIAFDADRQTLYDRISGTRLCIAPPVHSA